MMARCLADDRVSFDVSRTAVAVTALEVLQDETVLAAYSSYLVDVESSRNLKVFKHQAIHQVVCNACQSFLVACGGRSLALVDISSRENIVVAVPEVRLFDWIVAVQWVPQNRLAVLFSYNSVSLLDANLSVLQSVRCETCCIIYGGCIVPEPADGKVVCCSGTVFNEPLLWEPFSESEGRVLMSYKGHSGVIFDVKLNETNVFSVSDDRTLIVWNRRTGDVIHRLYGHTARVLKLLCLPGGLKVVTAGEDNRCITWSIKSGEKLGEYQPHTGYGIRSIAANERLLVTGGWDSRVVSYRIPGSDSPPAECSSSTISFDRDQAKWLTWISPSEILLQTASGRLVVHNCLTSTESEIISALDSAFRGYSVFCRIGCIVVIAGMNGDLCLFDTKLRTSCYVRNNDTSKVFSLTTVAVSNSNTQNILSCQDGGNLTLWNIQKNPTSTKAESVAHFVLPKCRNRWVTSAYLDQSRDCLIVGDRKGGLHLYQYENQAASSNPNGPIFSIPGLHGDNGISQISRDGHLLTSLGRDGNIRYFKITENKIIITKKHRPVAAVFWLEQILSTDWGTLLLYFHGQFFKVMVMETGETVFSVECGGSHRSWDIDISESCVRFAFINRSKVQVVGRSVCFNKFKIYGTVSHGSEIHAAVITSEGYTVTAGEDCTLVLHTPKSARQFSGHISSIRALCISGNLLFSAGGRGSLKAWTITSTADMELNCDYCVVSSTHIPVGYNSSYRFDQRNSNNDQRILSVDCSLSSSSSNYHCHVVCGMSNGLVYLLGYSSARFTRLLEISLNNCITRVILRSFDSESLTILAATTFGEIHSCTLTLINYCTQTSCSASPHSSGINGLDILHSCLLSIGDDGDVVKSSLQSSSKIVLSERRTVHFSAGIAVKFLGSSRFVSVGSDQRLVICKLSDMEPIFCCYVDVPDPHDLVLSVDDKTCNPSSALVCGKGLQWYRVSGSEML